MEKIVFKLDANAWHGSATETLWATPLGLNTFRVENSPFYAFGVSFDDIVSAVPTPEGLVFSGVIDRGGHSTYRLINIDTTKFSFFWPQVQQLQCTYEEGPNGLLAVDVPPNANIHLVYEKLEDGERAGAWDFEEGHCGHTPKAIGPLS